MYKFLESGDQPRGEIVALGSGDSCLVDFEAGPFGKVWIENKYLKFDKLRART